MNIFNKLTILYKYSNNKNDIINSKHLVLPGVGSFGVAYKNALQFLPMKTIYYEVFNKFKPILGICVGMQIMANYGYEILLLVVLAGLKAALRLLIVKNYHCHK